MRFGFRVLATMAIVALIAGCGLLSVAQPAEDDLATWSDHPLQPDPALATLALGGQFSVCTDAHDPGPTRILLQDRRTQRAAAFLVGTPTAFGNCMITSGPGGSGGGFGPALGAMAGALTIDTNGRGGVGGGQARLLGGRVVSTVARVVVALANGRSVFASIGGGYWLAWWPDTSAATSVSAFDASGASLVTVEWSE